MQTTCDYRTAHDVERPETRVGSSLGGSVRERWSPERIARCVARGHSSMGDAVAIMTGARTVADVMVA